MKTRSPKRVRRNAPPAAIPSHPTRLLKSFDIKVLVIQALLLTGAVVLAYMNNLSGPFIFGYFQLRC